MHRRLAALALLLGTVPSFAAAQNRLRVVTTLPTYAAIAREVTGELAEVRAIARGDEDPHFVNARPSFAALLQRADVFVTTGLDLELWVPALLDRANNPRIVEGAAGHVVAYSGIKLLDIPETVSRAGGDIHVFGNPHIHTDPINGIIIARNIVAALKRVDPSNGAAYEANLRRFEDRVLQRTFGDELPQLVGRGALFDLARTYRLSEFLTSQQYQGKPLIEHAGGWLAAAATFRGSRMVCYHKNWAYFSARFQVPCAMYIEPKPGIPPSPGHVARVIDFIRRERIPILFAANYFSRTQVERVASRAGVQAVIVPEHVDGEQEVTDYFELIDVWVTRLAEGYRAAEPVHP